MNLILLESEELEPNGRVHLFGPRATHITRVLHAVVGQSIRVGVLNGGVGRARVDAIDAQGVTLTCELEPEPLDPPRVDLLLALPRPKVLHRMWAQLAALGVGQIILTNAARVERDYFDTHVLGADEIRARLVEGLQQARDTWVPAVSVHRQFRKLVEDDLDGLAGTSARYLADPAATSRVHDAVRADQPARVLLAVGPEGGWNDFERALLQSHRFSLVGMGRRTLRTDTACLALLTLVHDALAVRA